MTRAVTTVSEKLKEVGYRTAHVGKWDVGMAHHSLTPEGRGFDTALSFFTHGPDYYTHLKVSFSPENCLDMPTSLTHSLDMHDLRP
jgi:arylsulfatase A-like enzyme